MSAKVEIIPSAKLITEQACRSRITGAFRHRKTAYFTTIHNRWKIIMRYANIDLTHSESVFLFALE